MNEFSPPIPQAAHRTADSRWTTLFAMLLAGSTVVWGCQPAQEPPEVEQARSELQLGRPQAAIDRLAGIQTAEACYLRGLALERTKLPDAARDQLRLAVEKVPDSLKYQGYSLRLALHDGREETADELIALFQKHLSSPHLALCAFYAYQSKSIVFSARGDREKALQSRDNGLLALKTALAQSEALPEYQLELLAFAITFAQGPAAEAIVDKLEPLLKSSRTLAQQRIVAKLLVGKTDDAVRAAWEFYRSENRSESAATLLSTALSRANATPTRDEQFADIIDRFPANKELLTKHVVYLARSNRLTDAVLEINQAISRQPDTVNRQMLQYVAIDLPLEAGSPDVAESQLVLYREALGQEMLIRYFEGRIAALRGQHERALELLGSVVEAGRKESGREQSLASEAARWMRLIHNDRVRTQEWQRLSDYVQGRGPFSLPGNSSNQPAKPAD